MNAIAPAPPRLMTVEEFLDWPGDGSGLKQQLFDGEVRTMAPASSAHAIIQANLAYLIGAAIRAANLPLVLATEGAVIPGLNASTNLRVPDLVVTAAANTKGQKTIPVPVLTVEVLSPSSRGDTRDNMRAYATLPSVREMLLVDSETVHAELYRRRADGAWEPDPEPAGSGGRVRLDTVGLHCPVSAIYRGTWLADAAGATP